MWGGVWHIKGHLNRTHSWTVHSGNVSGIWPSLSRLQSTRSPEQKQKGRHVLESALHLRWSVAQNIANTTTEPAWVRACVERSIFSRARHCFRRAPNWLLFLRRQSATTLKGLRKGREGGSRLVEIFVNSSESETTKSFLIFNPQSVCRPSVKEKSPCKTLPFRERTFSSPAPRGWRYWCCCLGASLCRCRYVLETLSAAWAHSRSMQGASPRRFVGVVVRGTPAEYVEFVVTRGWIRASEYKEVYEQWAIIGRVHLKQQ